MQIFYNINSKVTALFVRLMKFDAFWTCPVHDSVIKTNSRKNSLAAKSYLQQQNYKII